MDRELILGCISDTHGNIVLARRAIAAMGKVTAVLHAGDNYRDARVLGDGFDTPVIGVVGNCDYRTAGPVERIVELCGHRILLTHGHRKRVKRGLEALIARCGQLGASLCVFGHTHVPLFERRGGLLLVNPGSVSRPKASGQGTYAIIDCRGERPEARIEVVDEAVDVTG